MLPTRHLIFGITFSLILLFLFPQIGLIGFLIIILSTVLIDVDHYLYYVYKKKDWSLKHAYNWFIENKKKFLFLSRKQRNKFYRGFCFLHGIEILILLFILGKFLSIYFYYILIGVSFHLFLDYINQLTYLGRIDKFSLLHDFLKLKRLKSIEKHTNQ